MRPCAHAAIAVAAFASGAGYGIVDRCFACRVSY
jgi:hypothetical protein